MRNAGKVNLVDVISDSLETNGFDAIFNVPGYGGTDVLNKLREKNSTKTYINLNEEAAFSISYGVSSNGKRSALLIKSQGFVKALNAITSSLSTELSAANLIFVFDDTEGKSSDNILPTKNIIKSSEISFVNLGNNPAEKIAQAIATSERLRLPVAVLVDCKKLNNLFDSKKVRVKLKKINIPGFVDRLACPVLTDYQRRKLKNKFNKEKQKVLAPKIKDIRSVLPPKLLTEFSKYEKFMNVFKKLRPSFVSGDAGTSALFAFPPFNCIDTCTYMGGGPGMTVGAQIAGIKDAICITGDFSFLAAGILGLNEAVAHDIPLKIIIFNNGKAHATGGQDISPALMERFRKSFSDSIISVKINKITEKALEEAVLSFLGKDQLSIFILEI